MLLKGHYQNAYVTHDIEAAKQRLDATHGAVGWTQFEPDMVLKTVDGDREASVKAALGWYGGLQIELIQPTRGWMAHYAPMLPPDPADPSPRFHHIAVRRDDEAAMRAEIAGLGLPLACEGSLPGVMVFIYLDARATLGHYLEYVWATPEGWAMQGWPAEKPLF